MTHAFVHPSLCHSLMAQTKSRSYANILYCHFSFSSYARTLVLWKYKYFLVKPWILDHFLEQSLPEGKLSYFSFLVSPTFFFILDYITFLTGNICRHQVQELLPYIFFPDCSVTILWASWLAYSVLNLVYRYFHSFKVLLMLLSLAHNGLLSQVWLFALSFWRWLKSQEIVLFVYVADGSIRFLFFSLKMPFTCFFFIPLHLRYSSPWYRPSWKLQGGFIGLVC